MLNIIQEWFAGFGPAIVTVVSLAAVAGIAAAIQTVRDR